jgi:preprotein translocase subunit YajC
MDYADIGDLVVLAQATDAPAQPVNAVGVPGAVQTTPETAQPLGTGGAAPASPGTGSMIMWLLPAMLILMILMSVMGGRKEKKKRAELMSSLKKHDKVQTLGGIIGTVVEISDTEVVLRVEDGRIRFSKAAIQAVISDSRIGGDSIVESKSDNKTAAV